MVRKYKRKRPRPWRNKDKRMALAARMRAEGKSLREIGKLLVVHWETVRRDLARWDAQQGDMPANVISLSQKLSHSTVATDPPRGDLRQADATDPVRPIAINDRRSS